MLNLISLPYEVLSNIIGNIDFDDVFNLGRTCQALKFLLIEESLCKSIVQTKIAFSHEALSTRYVTGNSASALRRAAKRREAFASAAPYSIATIGFGDAYLYCNGVLCYTLDDRLRILDIHHSADQEVVVSIPAILSHATSESVHNTRGMFQVLYYSDNIVSCLYKSSGPDATTWIIAFNTESLDILVVAELDTTDRLFVRHNDQFLYYGTHSELGTDGYKKWVICGYDFRQRKWFDKKVHLPDMVGSEIGSTICFEFHDSFFYALSNQTSFEVEEIDWTSFYHCVRFPLASPCKELVEKTDNNSMWRRQHQEGPIDDRWTNLRLDMDERTGELRIVESRKEWYHGSSRSQRTYYITPIEFPKPDHEAEEDFSYSTESSFSSNITSDFSAPSSSQGGSTSTFISSSSQAGVTSGTGNNYDTLNNHNLANLPDDPILRLLKKEDNPHHMLAPPRLPQFTYPGNDGSSNLTFTLAKSRLRYYDTPSSTYLDIVDDPLPSDWQGQQRLRLRAGSRKIGPPLVYGSNHPSKAGLLCPPPSDLDEALNSMYRQSDITYWPLPQDPEAPNEGLDEIYRLLNPPTHLGNVEGTADERSLVYLTGGYGKPQAIIFVCFDPAIKLAGLKKWGGMERKGVGEGPHIDGRASGCGGQDAGHESDMQAVHAQELGGVIGMDRKGKGKEKVLHMSESPGSFGGHASTNLHGTSDFASAADAEPNMFERKRNHWMWKEKAMYRDIGLGFYFGKDRVEKEAASFPFPF